MASLATHFSAFVLLFPIGLRRLLCSSSLYLKNPSLYRSKSAFSGHPTYRFAFFQQSAAIFMFWALVILIICRENIDTLHIDEGFVFVIAAISFLVEYSVIGKGISGLGGAMPCSFCAEFFLSSGLVLKGTWILQLGLSLYTDAFGLKGCKKMSVWPNQENAEWKCDLEEDGLRGVSLMTLLNWNLRCGDASGPLLAQLDSGHVLMPSSLDLDME
ncbi:uncharacterized protein Pyn_14173 [Prunus yedoensis var. nudiflora]|uniref:Uncharacterized protein n=1 Tax=Prunus yedoensis var. nudiflora TaxID=2094558 RepID=A0A314Z9X7_PRUYE|nr:uncharacterized protein Pyn_14173 [Prunus yedoensis var. nudiflora]